MSIKSISYDVFLTAFGVVVLAANQAAMAEYPDRPIRLIIASAAGGSPDVVTRILAIELVKQMGQQIVIDNRPGAAQTLGTDMVVRAAADGYTIGYANVVTLAINKTLLPKQPYDPDRDLTLIGQFLSTANVLAVHPALPVKSVRDLVEYAKKNPGKLLNASAGNGTTGHLGGELFKIMTGTQIVHVPYRGSPQGLQDLMAGQVHLMFDNLTSSSQHVKAGKLRGLGVSGPRRSPVFPEMPTIAEAGVPGYETTAWGGLVAPLGTPRAIIVRWNTEVNKLLVDPKITERYFAPMAVTVSGGTPEWFAGFIKSDRATATDLVKLANMKLIEN